MTPRETSPKAAATRPKRKVKVGLVQMSTTSVKEENLAKAVSGIKEARSRGAELVCL